MAAAETVGEGGMVDLASVTDFPWDRLYVIPGYTPYDVISSTLGFEWQPESRLRGWLSAGVLLSYDSRWLGVFVRRDREVTGWFVGNLDFEPPYLNIDLEDVGREDAHLLVRGSKGDWSLELIRQP